MEECLSQLVQDGRCQRISTAFRAQRLQESMEWRISEGWFSLENMLMRISLGRRLIGERHSSSATCMSWRLGTPREDWESLAPMKKSDSSLSAGAGELAEEEDRESSCPAALLSPINIAGGGGVEA